MKKLILCIISGLFLFGCAGLNSQTKSNERSIASIKTLNLNSFGEFVCKDDTSKSQIYIELWSGKKSSETGSVQMIEIKDESQLIFEKLQIKYDLSGVLLPVTHSPIGSVGLLTFPAEIKNLSKHAIMIEIKANGLNATAGIAVTFDDKEEQMKLKCIKN